MRKSDGGYTYFVPDVAYHVTKWERGFTTAINVQGSDHHSTITRVRAGLQATGLGIPQGYPAYIIHKMVTVMKGGEEVKISKRAGSYLTLRELIDDAGRDAVRFFLVARKAESEFTFDIDLARSQTLDNPGLLRAVRERARRIGDAPGRHRAGGTRRPRCAMPISLRSRVRSRMRCCAASRRSRPSSHSRRANSRRIS